MKIYLDACCLNRPFDDQQQIRIHLEAEAVIGILTKAETDRWELVGSEALQYELERMPDPERRRRMMRVLSGIKTIHKINRAVIKRAQELERLGFAGLDSLHLACAELEPADIFLTTDDRLLMKAGKHSNALKVPVDNPLNWLVKKQGENNEW